MGVGNLAAETIYQRPYLRELIYQAGNDGKILNKEKKLEIDERRFLREAKLRNWN